MPPSPPRGSADEGGGAPGGAGMLFRVDEGEGATSVRGSSSSSRATYGTAARGGGAARTGPRSRSCSRRGPTEIESDGEGCATETGDPFHRMGAEPAGRFQLRSCTHDVAAERRFSCYHGGGASLIDHVLVSERLFRARKEVAIYNEALRDHGPFIEGAVDLCEDSDHALVTALFDASAAAGA